MDGKLEELTQLAEPEGWNYSSSGIYEHKNPVLYSYIQDEEFLLLLHRDPLAGCVTPAKKIRSSPIPAHPPSPSAPTSLPTLPETQTMKIFIGIIFPFC